MSVFEVIINAAGGSFVEGETDGAVQKAFTEAGLEANLTVVREASDLDRVVNEVVNGSADVIAAAGGDGTISLVAGVVAKAGKKLGVIPLGTLNHFARDLGIPPDIDAAVKVIATGRIDSVDMCEVNDRRFINNSSIGLYPRIVHKREAMQERLGRGKWSAALFAALQVMRRASFVHVRLRTGESEFERKTPFVFVGNNEYQMDIYNIGKRSSLTDGKLSVYILHHSGRWGVVRLVLRTIFSSLEQDREFESLTTEELTIETKRKTSVLVALDGEVAPMQTPLCYRAIPGALSVFVPREGQ